MPTVSYSLHLTTTRTTYDVLDTLFETERIEPIAGAGVLYTRGDGFLAHARVTESKLAEHFKLAHNIRPTVSVNYFPDGVSLVSAALDRLLRVTLRGCEQTDDDLLLVSNNTTLILRCLNNVLTLNNTDPFWTPNRLRMVDMPYQSVL